MSETVLTSTYVEPDRPYSKHELESNRSSLYKELRLGKIRATHQSCGHTYIVKYNGRKEKEILQTSNPDTGNCSVCWKMSRTPRQLQNNASDLVEAYTNYFGNDEEVEITYDGVDLEKSFYTWLYTEFNP